MAQLSARRLALAGLRRWRMEACFADAIISNLLAETKLSTPDRGFALELFYGVLRNLTLLDFWIGCLCASRVDVDLRDLLRLGLYQLFILKTAEHAAVNETVALATKRHQSVVNAVLRSAAREREKLVREAEKQLFDIRTSHPRFLIERWEKKFGAEAARALCEWNNQAPPIYARINRLKLNRQSFLER